MDPEVAQEAARRRQVLVDAKLFVDDPDALPDLLRALPHGVEMATLLFSYDTKATTGRQVRCAGCPQHQHHNRGFVVEVEGGGRALIGINCGEKHFGEGAWAEQSIDLGRRQEAAIYGSRVAPTIEALGKIWPVLNRWLEGFKAARLIYDQIGRTFPDLAAQLASAEDGRIEKHSMVKETYVAADGKSRQRDAARTELLGRIPYQQAFRGITSNGFTTARDRIHDAHQLLTTRHDAAGLAKAFALLRAADAALAKVDELHRGLIANLEPHWWDTIRIWTRGDYRVLGRSLADRSGQTILVVPRPSDVGPSLYPEVRALWPS